jgi:hypothetical protein
MPRLGGDIGQKGEGEADRIGTPPSNMLLAAASIKDARELLD